MNVKVLCVAGTRPNFVKVAALMRCLSGHPLFLTKLVHTGQHYDADLSGIFFRQLQMPRPDIELEVGSASHGRQTADILRRFEGVLEDEQPQVVLVVGDVNSTLACTVVAAKMSPPVRVAHVEAGLRSRDRSMPEEVNRIVTDALSDLLFTTSPDADRNLVVEGIERRRIHRVGNVMIDTLRRFLARADSSDVTRRLGIAEPFALLTMHRPSNVDEPAALRRIFAALEILARDLPIVFPVHPRTVKMIQELGVQIGGAGGAGAPDGRALPGDRTSPGLRLIEPLGYLDFLHLQKRARLVLTDSGGIQEEASILGVPCLTLRENTERPITLSRGTNVLVGSDTKKIVASARRILRAPVPRPRPIPLWDGRAAARIAAVFARHGHKSY